MRSDWKAVQIPKKCQRPIRKKTSSPYHDFPIRGPKKGTVDLYPESFFSNASMCENSSLEVNVFVMQVLDKIIKKCGPARAHVKVLPSKYAPSDPLDDHMSPNSHIVSFRWSSSDAPPPDCHVQKP